MNRAWFTVRARRLSRFRPAIEGLEGRTLPAVFSPLAATPDGDPGSLRAAIIAANGNGQDDTFNLEGATYELSAALVGFDNTNVLGDLDLTEAGSTYVFQGAGAGLTFIDANLVDRVLHVLSDVTVILRDLTITGGSALDNGVAPLTDAYGGGILNFGNLTLERVAVSGNIAGSSGVGFEIDAFGGGIASASVASVLTLISSSVVNNQALGSRGVGDPGRNALGGGIYARGTILVQDSAVSGNAAKGSDGAAGSAGAAGQYGGYARGGGLNLNSGTATITRSTISNNTATGGAGGLGGPGSGSAGGAGGLAGSAFGGGLHVSSTIDLIDSTVSDNFATGGDGGNGGNGSNGSTGNPGFVGGGGGDGGFAAGGGLISSGPSASIQRSTISGNTATAGNGGDGGDGGNGGSPGGGSTLGGAGGVGGQARWVQGGGIRAATTLDLINCTISGNSVAGGTGGTGGDGGAGMGMFGFPGLGGDGGSSDVAHGAGIHASSGLSLSNSTIAFNTAVSGVGGGGGTGVLPGDPGTVVAATAGGLRGTGAGPKSVISTIIAKNVAPLNPDVLASFDTALNNWIGDGTGSGLAPANPDGNGNFVGSSGSPLNPQLNTLGDNGGPTWTHWLSSSSPAINQGANPLGLKSDQRGFGPRAADGAADIGAYESSAIPPQRIVAGINGKAPAGLDQLRVFDHNGTFRFAVSAVFNRAKTKGVRVAAGDLNGDIAADVVAASGGGIAATVRWYDGLSGAVQTSFKPYGQSFKGGVFVAVGNVFDDLASPGNEIIVAANGKPIRIFDEAGQRLASFRPFGTAYKGAVRVAAGNVNGSGLDEIVATRGGPVRVRIFDSAGAQVLPQISPVTVGHPFLAVADFDQDSRADIILGDGAGSDIQVLDRSGSEIDRFEDVFGAAYTGGVRVGVVDLALGDGVLVLAAPGKNAGREAKFFQGDPGVFIGSFDAFPSGATGFFVAGSL